MATHNDERLHDRYAREHADHLARLAKLTPEQIAEMELSLHNALAEIDQLRAQLPSQGGEAVEVVGYGFKHVDKGWIFSSKAYHEVNPCLEGFGLMTVAQHQRILAASAAPALTVWCGPMPESNGKSNFTAVLMRKGSSLFDGLTGGITIERSEYPDRVRYEADRVRYLIGELDTEPDILAYDPDKHSGYTHSADQVAEGVVVRRELLERFLSSMQDAVRFGETGKGRPPSQTCLFEIKELRQLLAKSEGVKK